MRLVEFDVLDKRGDSHRGTPKLYDEGLGNRRTVLVNPDFVALLSPGELPVTDTSTNTAKVTVVTGLLFAGDGESMLYVPADSDTVHAKLVGADGA